jgi:hypothetical protein
MRRHLLISLTITALVGFPLQATAAITLGTAGDFAVLANQTVTNTGPSVIGGGHVESAQVPRSRVSPGDRAGTLHEACRGRCRASGSD